MPAGVRIFIAASGALVLLTLILAVLTAAGLRLPQVVLAIAGAVVAGASAAFARRGQQAGGTPEMLGVLLGGVPALVAVGMSQLVHWDDFMTWMPNARAIADFGLPAFAVPGVPSTWAAYPPAASLAVAAAWGVLGRTAETAPQAINVLALLMLPGLLMWETGPLARDRRSRAAAGVLLALAVTLANPALDWHWVLSGCPDTLLGVAVAIAAVLIRRVWLDPACPAEGDRERAWAVGLVLALIVSLKQTGVVTVALLTGATVLAALFASAPRHSWRRTGALAARALLPAVVAYIAWRASLTLAGAPAEMGFRPLSGWLYHVLPKTLAAIRAELIDRWLETLPVLLSTGVGLFVLGRGLWARIVRRPLPAATPAEQAAALFAPVWIGFSLFLIVANIGSFSEGEAVRAAEWMRYQVQVAPFGMLTAALWLWERRAVATRRLPSVPPLAVYGLAAVLAVGAAAATGLAGEPRPILGRHWAGVLDAAEVNEVRAIAAHAAREALASGAPSVTLAVRRPVIMRRPDQLSDWHVQMLTTIIARYEVWSARPVDPMSVVTSGPTAWRHLSPDVAAVIGGDGETPGSAVWTRHGTEWTCAGRYPDPPSLASRTGAIGD
jgi:hypothetical protein